jgi:CRP/FNR family transcriptional regulator, cyclic AMP receptor protein
MVVPQPIFVYTRPGCPFSPIAVRRVQEGLTDFAGIFTLVERLCSPDDPGSNRVKVTPTIVLPNGSRMTGTPSVERVRAVLAKLAGRRLVVPNKVWYLGQNRLFRGVPVEEIEKFAHLFRERDYRPKEVVFAEGDLGDTIYLLKTGHVRIYRLTEDGKEITLAVLGPGGVFGELALFDEATRQTCAETIDNAHICAASVEDFTRLMAHRPQLTTMVAREIARRRNEMETRIAGLAYGTVRGRLATALLQLATEHGERRTDGSIRIGVRLSHAELAHMIGTARESCTIELGKLQREGAITIDDDRYITIRDESRLEPGAIDKIIRTVVG